VAKPALCLDGDSSEDIPNNSPINCKKYPAKFGLAPKRSPFGAETNPLTRLLLDNPEDGLLAWVILVVLLLVEEPSSVSFLSVPENATVNQESSPKSLNSEAGSAPKWEVAAAVAVVAVAEPLPALLLAHLWLTSQTAPNTTSASEQAEVSLVNVEPDSDSTNASECATGPKVSNVKSWMRYSSFCVYFSYFFVCVS